ncbi:MAG: hypothetical protein D4R73_08315 [Deltaproteobacteria bacterium]|nr:MAG: hypothetical protein D4R73_08315 [Deltaproteobacteria bacterium]
MPKGGLNIDALPKEDYFIPLFVNQRSSTPLFENQLSSIPLFGKEGLGEILWKTFHNLQQLP